MDAFSWPSWSAISATVVDAGVSGYRAAGVEAAVGDVELVGGQLVQLAVHSQPRVERLVAG
jgi:hypothetical protein